VWQQFVQRNSDKAFRFVSVAVDTQGAEAVRPWTHRAGATFATVVDRENMLAALYDYKLVPNTTATVSEPMKYAPSNDGGGNDDGDSDAR